MKSFSLAVLTLFLTLDSRAQLRDYPSSRDEVKDMVDLIASQSRMTNPDLVQVSSYDGPPELIKSQLFQILTQRLKNIKSNQSAEFQELQKIFSIRFHNLDTSWHFWNVVLLELTGRPLTSESLAFLRNAHVLRTSWVPDEMPLLVKVVSWRSVDSTARSIIDKIFESAAETAKRLEDNINFYGEKHLGTPMHWLIKTVALNPGNWERIGHLLDSWVVYTKNFSWEFDLGSELMLQMIMKEHEFSLQQYAERKANDLKKGIFLSREELTQLLKYEIDIFREIFKYTLPIDFYKRLSFQENLQILIEYDEFHKKLFENGVSLQKMLDAAKGTHFSSDLVKAITDRATADHVDEIVLLLRHLKGHHTDFDKTAVELKYPLFTINLRYRIIHYPAILGRLWDLAATYPELGVYLREAFPESVVNEQQKLRGARAGLQRIFATVLSCVKSFTNNFKGDD